MIICPSCQHPNPEHAVQCEACFTALPSMKNCPNCGAIVQADASFCGQCGFSLRQTMANSSPADVPEPLPNLHEAGIEISSPLDIDLGGLDIEKARVSTLSPPPIPPPPPVFTPSPTRVQTCQAQLVHVQTQTPIMIPIGKITIHVGKPNDRIPPDIDVAGFPNSEIVSRIHADIRAEGDIHYLEDVGSANGTYVNGHPLSPGNRHRLHPGDRISLGKGDLVTFVYELLNT